VTEGPDSTKAERIPRQVNFDLISGLFICYVLAVHSCQFAGIQDNVVCRDFEFVFFFFMPWFFFKSGYFHKRRDTESIRDAGMRLRRLALPYVSWVAIGYTIHVALDLFGRVEPLHWVFFGPVRMLLAQGSEMGNLPLWFLLSFLFVQLLGTFAIRFESWILPGLPLVGWFLDDRGITLPLGLSNLFLGLFFFLCGTRYRILRPRLVGKIIYPLVLPTYLLLNLCFHSELDFRINHVAVGWYPAYVIGSVAGIVLLEWSTRTLGPNVLGWIGRNAILFFVAHWPILEICRPILVGVLPKLPGAPGVYATVLYALAFSLSALLIRVVGRNRFLVRN